MNKKLLASLILIFGVLGFAQFGRRVGQQGGRLRPGGGFDPTSQTGGRCLVPGYRGTGEEDLPTPRDIDRSAFVYARIRYHTRPWRGETSEVPWHHDYPDGDTMLPISLSRLTTTYTTADSYQIVDVDSKELFQYPFAYISEPGYLNLLPGDAKNLREYLDRGGFLLLDDFRGNDFDNGSL